ncbi:unnamed protein product [Paramecium pentaurelia]|uniref:Uncharacterized protein n=1 Tax=Paramecium pentaurelia TaxID=43138 RepID=A0A8S1UUB3_9CILI|nr:unnamed protein product [Paramecium pentaurelia]
MEDKDQEFGLQFNSYIIKYKIINNTASYRGGGFYFEEDSQRFTIQSTLIVNNSAEEAGGIYLGGISSLNQNNLIQSLVLFNNVKLGSNNIKEIPQHLSLSINQMEMQFQKEKLITVLFKTYNQNHFKFYLKVNGQQIQNFELYDPNRLKFLSYINEFTIKFKNSMNEHVINFSTLLLIQIIQFLILQLQRQLNLKQYQHQALIMKLIVSTLDLQHLIWIRLSRKIQFMKFQFIVKQNIRQYVNKKRNKLFHLSYKHSSFQTAQSQVIHLLMIFQQFIVKNTCCKYYH